MRSSLYVAMAGALGSLAYLVVQSLDTRILGNHYDDLVLWGGVVTADPKRQRLLGALTHLTIGMVAAHAFVRARPVLPAMPGWLQGIIFAETENAVLFPFVWVIDRVHPAVQRGQLPSLWTWTYFGVEALRHSAFGAVLGLLLTREDS